MNDANTPPTPNRTAYELGHLLMRMPANFDGINPLSAEDRKIVEAIREEAIANHETLMHGSEAMGNISFWAGLHQQQAQRDQCDSDNEYQQSGDASCGRNAVFSMT